MHRHDSTAVTRLPHCVHTAIFKDKREDADKHDRKSMRSTVRNCTYLLESV